MSNLVVKSLVYIALTCGFLFFIYAVRYYLIIISVLLKHRGKRRPSALQKISPINLKSCCGLLYGDNIAFRCNFNRHNHRKGRHGLLQRVDYLSLPKAPFISVHIPFYNESKKVIDRVLGASLNLDYDHYEIIVCDDSTDGSLNYIKKKWGRKKGLKILHRDNRIGYKGGALKNALRRMDSRTDFVVVFDADFIPYPDTLQLFLKYFIIANNGYFDFKKSKIGAIQGYQWHVLNKDENWITKGIYTEFGGSYVFDRYGAEIFSGFKQIAGSVFMVRADLLNKIGWDDSITEDWELTLNLYQRGYKVIYTPHIQTPAECVNTLSKLRKQRTRWAEGHTRDVRKHFFNILFSGNVNWREKLEFLFLSLFYLQSVFFVVGTISWLAVEFLFPYTKLPWWTAMLGWSLVFTNFLALPLVNLAALFLQRSDKKDVLGILSFIVLGWYLAPFQTWAALKGLLIDRPSYWHRTPKSGRLSRLFRRKKQPEYFPAGEYIRAFFSKSKKFKFQPGHWLVLGLLYFLFVFTLVFVLYSGTIKLARANPDEFYFHRTAAGGVQPSGKNMNSVPPAIQTAFGVGDGAYYFYSGQYPAGATDTVIAPGNYIQTIWIEAGSSFSFNLDGEVSLCDPNGGNCQTITSGSCSVAVSAGTNQSSCDLGAGQEQTIASANPQIIKIALIFNGLSDGNFLYDGVNQSSAMSSPTVTVPEGVIWFSPVIIGLLFLIKPVLRRKQYV
ncbi:MAG TPA: glycosyltransferase family 2 protein [Patescibacteria group bacterium]